MYSPQYKGLINLPEKSLFVSGLEPPCCNWGFPLTMTSRAARGGPSQDPAAVKRTV